jgi:hypothetical protein
VPAWRSAGEVRWSTHLRRGRDRGGDIELCPFGALTAAYLWQAGDLDRDEAGELAAHSEPIDDTRVQRIEFDAAGHAR